MVADDEISVAIVKARATIRDRYKDTKKDFEDDALIKELHSELKKHISEGELQKEKIKLDLKNAAADLKNYLSHQKNKAEQIKNDIKRDIKEL